MINRLSRQPTALRLVTPSAAEIMGLTAPGLSPHFRYAMAKRCLELQRKANGAMRTACRLIEFATAADPASAGHEPANPPMTMLLTWVRLSPTVYTPM